MKIIDGLAHVLRVGDTATELNDAVLLEINKFQKAGLEVEVQYQQSDCLVSALIIGRKEEGE